MTMTVVTDLHIQGKSVVIVGNGCAGAECINALRESGYKEKIHLLTDSRWPISNPMLTTYYVAGKIGFEGLFPYGAGQEFYLKHGVDVYPGSPVVALNAEEKVVCAKSGLEIKYDQCLIATGATPILPPIEGIGLGRIYALRTVEDAIRLKEAMTKAPKKALVIGASMVGIKVMELFYKAGVEVCLADLAQHIFPLAAHPECARIVEERLEQKGIKLRFGAGIERVEETACGIKAYFKDSAESEEADLLVMCIGVKANIGFIDRKQVAVDRGILVDEHMRTSMQGLYAAGDVAQGKNLLSGGSEMIGLWNNARYQGRTAGQNMGGENEFFPGNIPHNITRFMGMDFIGIGNVNDYDRMEKKYDGSRYIQLFWKDGFLTGANFLDNTTDSGVIKNALIKGLRQRGPILSGFVPVIENQLIKNILLEVQRT
ncbi:MAG TPA: NAD(P)/FAD-dependent oxidoreductase [Thermodesulfobacteriota bacterium]|nr:NAD(P)/FAD-dependent oxidoreductase [Thermodesulfobacteriota bacterium]